MASTRLQQAFPELEVIAPLTLGSQRPQPSVLHTMRREQLVNLARAFDVLDKVPKDGTKEDLLEAMIPLERAGEFRKSCEDPLALWYASKTADELIDMKVKRIPFPTREQLPLRTQKPMTEMAKLHEKAKLLGIASFGKKKHEIEAEILQHEMGLGVKAAPAPVIP